MLKYGLFLGWGAAPVCSSFSVAITPPVRNLDFPFGRPDASERMQVKMEEGNQCASWLLDLAPLPFQKHPFLARELLCLGFSDFHPGKLLCRSIQRVWTPGGVTTAGTGKSGDGHCFSDKDVVAYPLEVSILSAFLFDPF